MTTLSEILCKANKKYKDLNNDFKSIMKDIKALKELTKKIRKEQLELIDEYAKTKMIGKCYKFSRDGYAKYIYVLDYEIVDDTPCIIYERKYQGRINDVEIIKTNVSLLDIMFINVEEIDIDEYNSIVIEKKKNN